MIPLDYKKAYCYSKDREHIVACDFYIHSDCPGTCKLAKRLNASEDIGLATRIQSQMDKFWSDELKT